MLERVLVAYGWNTLAKLAA